MAHEIILSLVVLCVMPLALAIRGYVERAEREKAEFDEYMRIHEERLQRRIRESLDSADRLYVHTQERKPEPRVEPVPETQKAFNCPNCGAPISDGECCAYCGTHFKQSFPKAREMDAVLLPSTSVCFDYKYCSIRSTTISEPQCSVVFPPPRILRQ